MESIIDFLPLMMFAALAIFLFSGFPVAFVLGGIGLAFWLFAVFMGIENDRSFFLIIGRIYGGVVSNLVLVAIPMFIFMGTMLERSGIANDLLKTLQIMTRKLPGGLALSVTFIGVILAATTGIIGASVVMMTLLAMPVMLSAGYDKGLASGTIAASGTLGILIPPSIMLVAMSDLLSISAGSLFLAAVVPGMMLAAFYTVYIMLRAWLNPALAPPLDESGPEDTTLTMTMLLQSFLPPILLIIAVLGSIFAGIATPTEASGVGAAGALILAAVRRQLTFPVLSDVVEKSALTTIMLFGLFVGATAFSYVFALLDGHDMIISMIEATGAGSWGILIVLMIAVFFMGFFFDWIEITLIILPVFAPIIAGLDFGDHVGASSLTVIWFAVLMSMNLQTSFLTPPFGFALFYMKGAAPKSITIQHIYRGIVPFVLLQVAGLIAILIWPQIALWLPSLLLD